MSSSVLAYGPAWLLLFLLILIVVCVVFAWPRNNLPAPAPQVGYRTYAEQMQIYSRYARTPCKAALVDMGAMLDAI